MSNVILTRESVMALSNNTKVEGLVFVRSYVEKPTQNNNSTYYMGTAEGLGQIQFKVWQGEAFDEMKTNDYSNKVCHIFAKVNDYNGVKSLVVDKIEPYAGDDLSMLDFLEKKYDTATLWTSLNTRLKTDCSPEAVEIFNMIMEPIKDRFEVEFAAVNHHDNCVSGLLAHTSKVAKIAQIIKFYPVLLESVTIDALMVGCAIHDIGKVLEYNNGSISNTGKILNHLSLGLGLVMPFKDKIVELKGELFYDTLLSVIQQHHGEYGEHPKTLAAYLVHLFDCLESKLTDTSESIQNALTDTVKCEDFYLRFK